MHYLTGKDDATRVSKGRNKMLSQRERRVEVVVEVKVEVELEVARRRYCNLQHQN